MNGNTPYAGTPGITQAGRRAENDVPELTPEQKHSLRREVATIAARTRDFLPDEYAVDINVSAGVTGPTATVAVHPPAGHPVSAGFTPEADDVDGTDVIPIEDRDEVAQGLAASAALQVKQAVQDNVTPTAR